MMVMFDVEAGGRTTSDVTRFKVVVREAGLSELPTAMKIVFARFGARTIEDLPKPFRMTRCEDEVLVEGERKVRDRAH